MKFILLFGPPAVGKMSVGRVLEKVTGLKLFHNHMTIELVVPFFDFGTKAHNRLVWLFRKSIFQEVAKSELEGLIFTFVWALNEAADWKYVDKVVSIFDKQGAEIYYVELEADLEERLHRNKTPERLEAKPTKRDTGHSERVLLYHEENYRFNTLPGELQRANYLKINNTHLSVEEVARIVKEKFEL